MNKVFSDIQKERDRQINQEGFNSYHDDFHIEGELSKAAARYADHASDVIANGLANYLVPCDWPWDARWWKPKSPREDLIRSAALIVAEIERLDRIAAKSKATSHSERSG